jgi:hypothetical protein
MVLSMIQLEGPDPSDIDDIVDAYLCELKNTGRYDAYELERAASTTRREAKKWFAFLQSSHTRRADGAATASARRGGEQALLAVLLECVGPP